MTEIHRTPEDRMLDVGQVQKLGPIPAKVTNGKW